MTEDNELNVRQLKFIDGLMEGKTQKKAYIEAGYEVSDDNAAESNSSRLIRNDKVRKEIQKRLEDVNYRNKLRLYRVSEVAITKMVSILESDSEIADSKVKADLIKYILEIIGLKPAEEHNINLKGELGIYDPKQKLISEIDKLAAKGTTGQDNSEDDG